MSLSDKGFAVLRKCVVFDLAPCNGKWPHDFFNQGQIAKYEPAEASPSPDGTDAKGEVILMAVYVCQKCLMHAYVEIARQSKEHSELHRQMQAHVGIPDGTLQ